MDEKNKNTKKKKWTDEIEVAGSELIKRAKELVKEGNVRRLIIRKDTGEILIEVPLTAGVAVTLFAPTLVALGAIAGLLTKVKIEIVRKEDDDTDTDTDTDVDVE